MKRYQQILLALDLHERDHSAENVALEIRNESKANLSIVHAVEHLNSYGSAIAYPAISDLEQQIYAEAKKLLLDTGSRLEVPAQNQYIEIGSPKPVIVTLAQKIKADLIIVGSHSRHGWQLLLGSTANAVLHDAPCDVLAVRLKD